MNQTGLLLASVHGDITNAHNILTLVSLRSIPTTIEDTMYAYMVAKDWCDWITNPDTPDNPLREQNVDFSSHLAMFQCIRTTLERELKEQEFKVGEILVSVNSNLVSLLRSPLDTVKENTAMYFRSLRYTANLIDKQNGNGCFNAILDEHNVPVITG